MKANKVRNRIMALAIIAGLVLATLFTSGCAVGRHFEQRWEQAAVEATESYSANKMLAQWQASGHQGQIRYMVAHNDRRDSEGYKQSRIDKPGTGDKQIRYVLAYNDQRDAGSYKQLRLGNSGDTSYQAVAYGKANGGTWAPLEKVAPFETVCRVIEGKLKCFVCTKFKGCVVPLEGMR